MRELAVDTKTAHCLNIAPDLFQFPVMAGKTIFKQVYNNKKLKKAIDFKIVIGFIVMLMQPVIFLQKKITPKFVIELFQINIS